MLNCCSKMLVITKLDPNEMHEKPLYENYIQQKMEDSADKEDSSSQEREEKKRKNLSEEISLENSTESKEETKNRLSPKKQKENQVEQIYSIILEISKKLRKQMSGTDNLWKKIMHNHMYSLSSLLQQLEKNSLIWESEYKHLYNFFPNIPFNDKSEFILKILIECSSLKAKDPNQTFANEEQYYFVAETNSDVLNFEMEISKNHPLFRDQLNKNLNQISEEMRGVLMNLYDLALNDKGNFFFHKKRFFIAF